MLLGAFLVPTNAHALTGTVTVNGGTTITVGPSVTTISVPIKVSASDGFNGFQIIVSADPTVLSASSVDLTGSVLPSPAILAECIDGVLIAGTSCANQAGTVGTVELAAANNLGGATSNPVTGTIFTINFNVVGTTGGTKIGFQTGCSSTSTGNSDCVQIASSGAILSESDLAATFINQIGFSQTPAHTSLSTPSGVPISDLINYAAIGPFADFITETATCSGGLTSCTLASGSPGSVDLADFTTGSDTLTVSGTSDGSATVHACDSSTGTICDSVTIPVKVASPGFTLATNQASVQVSRGSSNSSTVVTVKGFSGFTSAVSFATSSAQAGVTGSANPVTPTADGSGYTTGTSVLTVSVALSVPTGSYMLTVTGNGGPSTTLTVIVPNQQYSVQAVPNSITILRGGTVAVQVVLTSSGGFTGTASLAGSASPVAGQQDSCCLTNNITPSFSQNSVTLPPDGTAQVTFFASTVGASSPSTETNTGNYTATVSVMINGVPGSTVISFTVIDFSVGPTFCTGSNLVATSESDFGSLDSPEFLNDTFAGIFIGSQCNSLTISAQPNVLPLFLGGAFFGPVTNAQALLVKTGAFGGVNTGLQTNGWNGAPAIGFLNPEIPANGVGIPQLAVDFPVNGTHGFTWPSAACLLPTFWANGTQIPYSYLAQNGPLIIPGSGVWAFFSTLFHHHPPVTIVPPGALGNWGCKFDATAWPNDAGVMNNSPTGTGDCVNPGAASSDDCGNGVHVPRYNNPDYSPIIAMSIVGTLPGVYGFQICGQAGVLRHCQNLTLNVVNPNIHQFVAPKSVSFSAGHGLLTFKLGIDNPTSPALTIFVQDTVTAVGSFGDVLTAVTPVLQISPGGAANNVQLSFVLTSSMIGETFTFSQSMAVGTDAVNLNGVSTQTTNIKATGTFRVTA